MATSLVYATTTGNTETVAGYIAEASGLEAEDIASAAIQIQNRQSLDTAIHFVRMLCCQYLHQPNSVLLAALLGGLGRWIRKAAAAAAIMSLDHLLDGMPDQRSHPYVLKCNNIGRISLMQNLRYAIYRGSVVLFGRALQ